MVDTLSDRTKENIATVLIAPEDDYYPDRSVVDQSITTGTPIPRLPRETVPTTSQDMSNAFKWQYGDKLHGRYAKDSPALKEWRRDIEAAWGNEDDYKPLYLDTNKKISDEYKKWK